MERYFGFVSEKKDEKKKSMVRLKWGLKSWKLYVQNA